mmetsp:Transcript_9954/g.24532  ORF Transcript_9954/g.24532 Transcript_9954/m.24532 type:complete len:222 (-) Transcript_9954:255-920(-)
MRGHWGQGLPAALSWVGLGRISKLTTEAAPWRTEVPMQSLPVSPPPMTTTRLPCAQILSLLLALSQFSPTSPESRIDLVFLCRNSIARWMPLSSRPSQLRSRAMVAPVATRTASNPSTRSLAEGGVSSPGTSLWSRGWAAAPTLPAEPTLNVMPSADIRSALRCTICCLSAFMLGTPYIIRPPTLHALSYTVTRCPALFSWSAAASPAGPDPMTATFLPVR